MADARGGRGGGRGGRGGGFSVPVAHVWDRSVTVEVPAAGVIQVRDGIARVDRVR
jgi:hypothetical protein